MSARNVLLRAFQRKSRYSFWSAQGSWNGRASSGSSIENVVPNSGVLTTFARPPCASAQAFTEAFLLLRHNGWPEIVDGRGSSRRGQCNFEGDGLIGSAVFDGVRSQIPERAIEFIGAPNASNRLADFEPEAFTEGRSKLLNEARGKLSEIAFSQLQRQPLAGSNAMNVEQIGTLAEQDELGNA
jgi:hypothetical protein